MSLIEMISSHYFFNQDFVFFSNLKTKLEIYLFLLSSSSNLACLLLYYLQIQSKTK
jgi:hypothetical protein